jgi:DNA polymerase III sliding clamp (beta) subunit (PCNA family)
MIEFTLVGDRNDLLATLTQAERFVSKTGSNDAIRHIRIYHSTTHGKTFVEATNQVMGFRGHLWANFDQPEIDVLASPRIVKAIGAMRSGEVRVSKEGGELTVRGTGKGTYAVPVGSGSFPSALPGIENVDWSAIQPVDAGDALREMQASSRFTAKGHGNPAMSGINLRVVNGNSLGIDATDSYRLFQSSVDLPAAGFPFGEDEVILPVSMVHELVKLFPAGDIKFSSDTNLFFASDPAGTVLFACRRVGGKFPNVDTIVPTFNAGMTAKLPDLREAVVKLRSVAGGRAVSLDVRKDELVLSSRSDDGSAAEEYVPITATDEVKIGFNLDHLHEGLALFGEDEVTLSFTTPLRPALLSNGVEKRRYLIMPVRVTSP